MWQLLFRVRSSCFPPMKGVTCRSHASRPNLVSEHEFLDYRWVDQFLQSTFFDESLLSTSSAFSSSYMFVNASSWNVVKNDGNKKKKKSFGASSARVCSKASCGLASQINVDKKKHGTWDRWPKKTRPQATRSESHQLLQSHLSGRPQGDEECTAYCVSKHCPYVDCLFCASCLIRVVHGLIYRLTAHELILDRWTLVARFAFIFRSSHVHELVALILSAKQTSAPETKHRCSVQSLVVVSPEHLVKSFITNRQFHMEMKICLSKT